MGLFEPIFSALNAAGIRYVVVGGLAVVLHGHARLTADIDLVLDLQPGPARKAMESLVKLGLKARAPADPLLILDLFVKDPLPFDTDLADIAALKALKRARGGGRDA